MPEAKKLRRQYVNNDYPHVILRFEDGHEIQFPKGVGKAFDAWKGETVKVLAVWDPTSGERELVESKKGEEFDEVKK
ncbi:MAG: hypothetical protein HOQ11_10795 [Gemmatimonadaceae bacterium]|jgi:hypothetical protein|nr:hypothetical protein [Gemmatimonadaceae bacterium]NUQ94555.1 hypothetical protein [Gemmatimonadaceae bacterium]NUR19822.1 hypothetical protein [Gemmatimonadaceae bacterium]NUS97881.1 hypothetical protein [Gemmatimonadaceae bacterium]